VSKHAVDFGTDTRLTRQIRPGRDAQAWCGGRWGPRRARVDECAHVVKAEDVYTSLLASDATGAALRQAGNVIAVGQLVAWELRPNRIWRLGRVFLRCPRCSGPSTRLYAPQSGAQLACRRCWGLSYSSRQNSYRRAGWSALFGTMGAAQTQHARDERRAAARARYESRRQAREGLQQTSAAVCATRRGRARDST